MIHRDAGNPQRGFTLVELLVVIGIIALLIGILLPSLNIARQTALGVKCLSNMKQLSTAYVMYANDNKGWLPSCDTAGPLGTADFYDGMETPQLSIYAPISATNTWIGWVDSGPTAAAMTNGTLWKYLKQMDIYKCPSDFNDYRLRSYSINSFLCTGGQSPGIYHQYKLYRITQVRDCARTIAFVEEPDPRGVTGGSNIALLGQWNRGGWLQNPTAANLPTGWVDLVASWHRNGANFTFVDGHAEYWRYADKRTSNYLKNDPTWPNPYYITPNNPDLLRIQNQVVTWNQQRN